MDMMHSHKYNKWLTIDNIELRKQLVVVARGGCLRWFDFGALGFDFGWDLGCLDLGFRSVFLDLRLLGLALGNYLFCC